METVDFLAPEIHCCGDGAELQVLEVSEFNQTPLWVGQLLNRSLNIKSAIRDLNAVGIRDRCKLRLIYE